jgi:hypothetical protein
MHTTEAGRFLYFAVTCSGSLYWLPELLCPISAVVNRVSTVSTVALYHENIKVGTYIVSTRDTDHTLVYIHIY